MNWALWLKGLISAAVGGVATAVTTIIVDPETFNLETGMQKVLTVAGVTAILNVANYLKKSPLPDGGKL